MAQSAVHTVHHQMHQKSYRIRSLQSENKRRERLENRNQQWEEDREERREIRRERNDSVGPLPGDPAPETVNRYNNGRYRSASREPAYSSSYRRRRDDYDDDYDDIIMMTAITGEPTTFVMSQVAIANEAEEMKSRVAKRRVPSRHSQTERT